MIFAFMAFSCIFMLYLFCIWSTANALNIFIKMYSLLLTVYFGYSTFVNPIFQSFLN